MHRWALLSLTGALVIAVLSSATAAPVSNGKDEPCTSKSPAKSEGYLERYKQYRYHRAQRHSEEMVFNPVRQRLLMSLLFTPSKHRELIDEETRVRLRRVPPLPPGVQKHLTQGNVIPPHLLEDVLVLPPEVLDYLGFQEQPHTKIGILGNAVLLYDGQSGKILDMLPNVL